MKFFNKTAGRKAELITNFDGTLTAREITNTMGSFKDHNIESVEEFNKFLKKLAPVGTWSVEI